MTDDTKRAEKAYDAELDAAYQIYKASGDSWPEPAEIFKAAFGAGRAAERQRIGNAAFHLFCTQPWGVTPTMWRDFLTCLDPDNRIAAFTSLTITRLPATAEMREERK